MIRIKRLALVMALGMAILAACSDSAEPPAPSSEPEPSRPEFSAAAEPPAASSVPPSSEPDDAPTEPTPESEPSLPQPTEAETASEPNAYQLYYEYLRDNFKLTEYRTAYGAPSEFWSHTVGDEARLMKIAFFYRIDGFDYPVMIHSGYSLLDDGVTIDDAGWGQNAYLIKDGEVTGELDEAELDAVFAFSGEGESGWSIRGERLFFRDMADGSNPDGSEIEGNNWEHNFQLLLDWIKENDPSESAADTASAEYHGLTKEEWEGLQEEKAIYETLSDEERDSLGEGGGLGCSKFIHMYWEGFITVELIRQVGVDQFEAWLTEQGERDECVTIYSFADQFSMDLEALTAWVIENNHTETYPPEKLKARYPYMSRNGGSYVREPRSSDVQSALNTNAEGRADITFQIAGASLTVAPYSIKSTENLWWLLPIERADVSVRGWPDIVFSADYADSARVYDYAGMERFVRSDSIEPVPVPDLIFRESLVKSQDGTFSYAVRHSSESSVPSNGYAEVEERGYIFVVHVGEDSYSYSFRIFHDGSHL